MQVCALRAVPGMISGRDHRSSESPVVRGLPVPSGFTSTPRDGHPLFAGFVKAATSSRSVRRSKKKVRTATRTLVRVVCLEFQFN